MDCLAIFEVTYHSFFNNKSASVFVEVYIYFSLIFAGYAFLKCVTFTIVHACLSWSLDNYSVG